MVYSTYSHKEKFPDESCQEMTHVRLHGISYQSIRIEVN